VSVGWTETPVSDSQPKAVREEIKAPRQVSNLVKTTGVPNSPFKVILLFLSFIFTI